MKKIIFLFLILIPINTYASTSIAVMDLDSGRVLYQSNAKEKKLIASITKIMTAIITIENINLDKKITVGEEVLKSYGTNTYIEVGEELRVIDLLYGLILRSGNDAAMTLAKSVSSSEEDFISLMNQKAEEIGMKNTHFENPHGLDEESENYSTAYDYILLSRYAYQNKIYKEIAGTKKYRLKTNKKSYIWYNRNKLLSNYKYCTGGKNGYTPSAGKTLVTTASKNGLNLTIVTLNDPSSYDTHESLYNYYFDKYKNIKVIDKSDFNRNSNLLNTNLTLEKSFYYPLTSSEQNHIKTKVEVDSTNHNNASLIIYLGKEIIGTIPFVQK
ncbi:MAG: D-alanyl-D-alanine carboxypeptidase [Bacilli bacterium]|nr:D-alanyl-D-alanine carboxypeptidase [Bacilli bacterium]